MKHVTLHYATWEQVPYELQDWLIKLLGGDLDWARRFYKLYFYWYSIPFEMGLIIRSKYGMNNKNDIPDRWNDEKLVHEFAVAYWRQRGERKRLAELEELVIPVVSLYKSSIPYNNAQDYFNQNYAQLRSDTRKMGYFHLSFFLSALRKNIDFYTALKTYIYPEAVQPYYTGPLPYLKLDADLPSQIVADMRRYLKPYGVEMPPTSLVVESTPLLQFVEIEGDESD
jgi:hypothetical protein